ncbi:MAG: NAD(P)-dependent oxidoreductase [Bryobacteraceae bacterium]|nr:NAD(P)-dependent oxidoreductase [Bryobacteraceae bacterium]
MLVTGASGFVGVPCLRLLESDGFEVHVVGRTRSVGHRPPVAVHGADLLDHRQAERLIADVRPSHLLHLAWETEHGKFWSAETNLAWAAAGLHLLRAFADAGGERAVVAGTCAEYRWEDDRLIEGTTRAEPRTLYGACKHALHVASEAYAELAGFSLAWCRLFFLYGPREDRRRFVPSVIRPLLRGQAAALSHGRQVRDFLHVDDVAEAFVALLGSDVSGAINIASGNPVTLREVAALIADLIGRPGLLRFEAVPSGEHDPPAIVGDTTRLRDELGWRPQRPLRTGLAQTIEWWRGCEAR